MISRLPALLVLCLGFAGCPEVMASERADAMTDVVQVAADLTLIDGACRGDVVNFGVVFRFINQRGVADVSVMPGGTRRGEFEAALRNRRARFSTDELCGEIAANYAEALPGSVTFPTAVTR